MPLRIAFDLDGVFADMSGALRRLAAALPELDYTMPAGDDSPPDEVPRELTAVEHDKVWQCARRAHNFWETLDEIEPGSLLRLRTLSRERRWHVVFVTQRPRTSGDSPQLQTQRWLARQGFDFPSVLVVPGNRGKLAHALNLDFVVDDVPAYCLDVKLESPARSLLIWRQEEEALAPGTRRLGIEVFPSVASCLDYLETCDNDRRAVKRPGFVGSIKRKLGLVHSASS